MKYGHFGSFDQIEMIAAAGYDCVEMFIWDVMSLDEGEFVTALQKLRNCPISCDVFTNPLPRNTLIADEGFDFDSCGEYVKRAVERASKAGVRYFVFGCGKNRKIPDDKDRKTSEEKNLKVIAMVCDIAADAGIVVLLEPLGASVTNFALDIPEIVAYMEKIARPNLKTMVDYRWFLDSGRPFSELEIYANLIQHAHVDCTFSRHPERVDPSLGDGCDYTPFFDALKKISYQGIVSVEANTFTDFDRDIRKGMELLTCHGIPN